MKLGNAGLSLVAVIVASGAVSGLSLVIANLNKQQLFIQRKVKTHFEISNISNSILSMLFDSRACTYTLGGSGITVFDGRPVPAIKNQKGSNKFTTNKSYGSNTFNIESIALADVILPAGSPQGSANLKVTFKKIGKALKGYQKVVKSYPLSLDLDTALRMTSCHTSHEGVIFSVSSNSCSQVGGIYNATTGKCIPSALRIASKKFCEGIGGVFAAPLCNMENVIENIVSISCKGMDGTYRSSFKRCELPPVPSP